MTRQPRVVAHVGTVNTNAGGMAQVLNDYAHASLERTRVVLVQSTRGRGDRAWPFRWLRAAAWILTRRLLKAPPCFVVHLSQGGSFVREGSLLALAKLLGFRVVAHIHGSSFDDYFARRSRLVISVLSRADLILCLTSQGGRSIRVALPRVPVQVIENPVDIPHHVAPILTRRKRIIFGGAVGYRKGVDVLIEAWDLIERQQKDEWELCLYGPQEDPALSEIISPYWRGEVSRESLQDQLSDSQVAVLPSRGEALPVFLLESLARGCATISTDVGDIPNLMREGSGLTVPPGDVRALAAAIQAVIANDSLRVDLGHSGRRRAKRDYSTEVVMSNLERAWLGVE
jgi:glycosyltransferase involved in cell wall biosynthesis